MINFYITLEKTINISTYLLSFTLFLTGLEFVYISFQKKFHNIWSFNNLRIELRSIIPIQDKFLEKIFSIHAFRYISILQVIISVYSIFFPNFYSYLILIFSHLYICMRFRGSFNGGSDMMLFVLLTGTLWINLPISHNPYQKWGLIYIGIHVIYSYLKSGLVKVVEKDWRSGKALVVFLSRSHFPQAQNISCFLLNHKYISIILCWLVIFFELSIFLIFTSDIILIAYLITSFCFHFLNYFTFGLNRFFLTWMAGWPAVCFLAISL